MVTLTVALVGGAVLLDHAATQLASDVARALRRCDLKQEWVAAVISVPRNKLNDQLTGKAPFTFLWRLLTSADLREAGFQEELLDLLAERIDRAVITPELSFLIRGHRKVMAKAALTPQKAEKTA